MSRRHGSVNRNAYLALMAVDDTPSLSPDEDPLGFGPADKPIREESETGPYYAGRTYDDAAVCEPQYTMVRRIA